MRLHPGIGVTLERIVPAGGLTLKDGRVGTLGLFTDILKSMVTV